MIQYSIMNYHLSESAPMPERENMGISLDMFGYLTPEEYANGVKTGGVDAVSPLMAEYNALWNNLKDNLQDPTLNDGSTLTGFTGHRIVTFEGEMGQAALGFQIVRFGADATRSIVAYRRKLYADDIRRQDYLNDELIVYAGTVESAAAKLDTDFGIKTRYDLGVLGVWLDKYLDAEPYSE